MNSNSSDLMSYCSRAKKIQGIESPLETLFLVSISIIESILLLATQLEVLLVSKLSQITNLKIIQIYLFFIFIT